PLVHDDKPGNIGAHEKVRRGDADAGFAEADEVVEDTFTFPMVYHYAMEPHSVIAQHDGEEITVWSSAQHPFQVRGDIARLFKVPAAKVRLLINYLGGGYGSKSYTKFEPLVVALARKAKQPVRICNSVGESMVTVRRHGARVRIKTGVKRDGTILARAAEIYLDTGGYDDNGPQVTARSATRILGPYWIPNIRTDAYQVYTNTGSAGSYRAIAAEELTLPMESFRIAGADTKVTPYDSSTGSSRSTTLMGTAVQKAARDLRQQFVKIGAQVMGVKPAQIEVADGALICGESRLTFK